MLGDEGLEDDRNRLAAVSLLVALAVVGVVVVSSSGALLGWEREVGGPRRSPLLSPLPLLPVSLLVLVATRWRALSTAHLRWLGTGYQYLGAGILVLSSHWTYGETWVPVGFFSWLAVWILLFPLVMPRTPLRNIGDSLVCALVAPLAIVANAWERELPTPGFGQLFVLTHPYFACALFAAGPAVVLGGLRQRAEQERAERRRLGSYRLVLALSEGGMGEVWLGEHQLLIRPAAVKLIRKGSLSVQDPEDRDRVLARFEREAQQTAMLSSPHSVTIYDFGRTSDGSFYCAMELLQGLDLEQLVHRCGPLPAGRVCFLLAQACESLAEAHARDLVHRDVKPANLFVCQRGLSWDFLKVLDFGLVISLAEQGRSTRLSGEDTIVGTPSCMAPEQVLGGQVDARADLYGLGCVAYFLLTGRYPFAADTVLGVLTAHARDTPAPPSQVAVSEVPPALEALVLECLAKDPLERPQSALELRERLEGLELEPWTPEDAEAWWRERPLAERPPGVPGESTLLLPGRLSAPSWRAETSSWTGRVIQLDER